MSKEDIVDVLHTVLLGLACPFALLFQPSLLNEDNKDCGVGSLQEPKGTLQA